MVSLSQKYKSRRSDWIKISQTQIVQLSLITFVTSGISALVLYFVTPSMERNAFLLGYSKGRLLTGGLFLIPILILFIVTVKSIQQPDIIAVRLKQVNSLLLRRPTLILFSLFISLFLTSIGLFVLLLLQLNLVPDVAYQYTIAIQHAFPALLWAIIMPGITSIVIIILFRRTILQDLLPQEATPTFVIYFLVITLTAFDWVTLITRASWPQMISGWFWDYAPKSFQSSHWIASGSVFLAASIAWSILANPSKKTRNVFLAFVVGVVLQFGFGFALGSGIESVRGKYTNTPLSDQLNYACEIQEGIIPSIANYKNIYGDLFWSETKPPGLMTFYIVSREVVNLVSPGSMKDASDCFTILSSIYSYILPLFAAGVVFFLYIIERLLSPQDITLIPALLYVATPNFILMLLIPDQFLFPPLFIASVAALVYAVTKNSFGGSILSGMLIYLSIFVSFSLIPLLGLCVAWLFIESANKHRESNSFRRGIIVIGGIVLGVAIFWLFGQLALDYNPIERYSIAFRSHRINKVYKVSIPSIITYSLLNNLEFGFWSSIPILILTAVGSIKAGISSFRRKISLRESLAAASLITWLALNIFGQTKGETGRLWLFILPLAAIIASTETDTSHYSRRRIVMMIFIMQLITAILMFMLMDWR